MKIRLISGSCYVAMLVAFYCLKIFVHDFFFDAFLYAVSLLGTYEMLRALKDKMTSTQSCVTFAFAIVAVAAGSARSAPFALSDSRAACASVTESYHVTFAAGSG